MQAWTSEKRRDRFRTSALLVGAILTSQTALASEREQAKAILAEAGTRGGLVVHLGCGNGSLTAALRLNDSYLVHGLDASAANVAVARRHIREAGLYGAVSVDRLRGPRLPYAENLVNLVVVSRDEARVSREEIKRVLAPGGACVGDARSEERGARWEKMTKPWPTNVDEWTHFLHGPDNNAVARDTVVGPPSRVQWAAGPLWSRDHDVTPSVFAPVSAKGRLFYVLDEGPVCVIDKRLPERRALVARDAFNGVLLWRRPLSSWYSSRVIWGHIPAHSQRRLVADGDRVYVTLGLNEPVTALDAATGRTVREFPGTAHTSEIVCDQGVLALAIRREEATGGLLAGRDGRRFRKGYVGPQGSAEAVMAVDAATGACLWRQEQQCMPLTLALSGGRTFFVAAKQVLCLDAKSGTELWRVPFPARTLVVHGDAVVAATDRNTSAYHKAPKTIEVRALSARDGTQLWTASADCLPNFNFFYVPVDTFVARGQVWGLAEDLEWNKKPGSGNLLGLDLATGRVKTRIPLAGAFTPGHHVRCYKGKATERFLLLNKRGIEFLNIESGGKPIQHQWIRGACRYGILPCNGLLYAPSHACACYPGAQLNGFHALAGQGAEIRSQRSEVRIERGPAFRQIGNRKSKAQNPEDWPTYRHDIRRSGSTATVVPHDVETLWQVDVGGKLSAPVAAAGRVYFAAVDEHAVYCLNAEDGRMQWSFTAGARVDSPPTIHEGKVVFGSRDGWCYCLRAADGKLIWRFRAAPTERLVGAFGQLESAWPLHGSVLVKDGVVYLAAGRSSFVDGGIHVHGLDVETGSVRHRTVIAGPDPGDPKVKKTAGRMPGAVPDILASDGESLYLRHVRLNRDLSGDLDAAALSWGLKGNTYLMAGSGFLDDSLFNRTVWKYGIRVDRSQMLVVDGTEVYGLRVYSGISWNCPVHKSGSGYLLFRQGVGKPVPRPPQKPRQLNRIPYERYTWHVRVPVRVCAMVLTGASGGTSAESQKRLFVAGQPDEIDPDDPLAAFEGRKGGRLLVLSGANGETLAEQVLKAPPVWDGMIAYRSRLYVALRSGAVLCLGKGG